MAQCEEHLLLLLSSQCQHDILQLPVTLAVVDPMPSLASKDSSKCRQTLKHINI